jgi:hypothetical protein
VELAADDLDVVVERHGSTIPPTVDFVALAFGLRADRGCQAPPREGNSGGATGRGIASPNPTVAGASSTAVGACVSRASDGEADAKSAAIARRSVIPIRPMGAKVGRLVTKCSQRPSRA